jgi:RNA 2',3'-cyclic 3'-phosphodiesterase
LRWSAPESWHITLQFLGNTAEYACIVARLRDLRSATIGIEMEGLGFFERAGVFFAGVTLTEDLEALQKKVTSATADCGFIPETRPYHPHITLARSKSKGARAMQELKGRIHREPNLSHFVAEQFVLYESHLGARGSQYEIRERFALSG